ncbi:Ent-kaurene synthase-like [Thalictrum thalictroides]|uniref:Ent-kaurene synthase-like n=1 Tax=Thalictrum thalictroides TaxID=46969 RepID=A0A7J6VY32_THATH|nr:Ent-kaurene synthase-like [Thalictrum thalictroides]
MSRCWLQRDEEIFLDMQTCALAFRLLKINGYEVSSDVLADFNKEKHFFESSAGGQNLKDIYTVMELYKASEISTSPDDLFLETLHSWTSCFLKQGLENGAIPEEKFQKQVENALEFPYDVNLDRLDNKRNIESYNVDEIQILKALHR